MKKNQITILLSFLYSRRVLTLSQFNLSCVAPIQKLTRFLFRISAGTDRSPVPCRLLGNQLQSSPLYSNLFFCLNLFGIVQISVCFRDYFFYEKESVGGFFFRKYAGFETDLLEFHRFHCTY